MVFQSFELAGMAIKTTTDRGLHALGCIRRKK